MPKLDHLLFCRETLEARLHRLQQPGFKIYLPRPLGRFKCIDQTHFHFHPELFLQTSGRTEFRFPQEKINLSAGESLLIPRGLPHGETARNWRGDFLNLVVMFLHDGVSLHAAQRGPGNKPQVLSSEYFKTSRARQIEQYLDDIADLHLGRTAQNSHETNEAIRGLFQSTLATLLLVLKQSDRSGNTWGSPKVRESRIYIISHLYDSALSVKKIATGLRCSADYLSHLFATETGQHLTDYIQQERMALAKQNLSNLSLSIKEIAWSCGFSDPGYFSRLFKRLSGKTPKAYRKMIEYGSSDRG